MGLRTETVQLTIAAIDRGSRTPLPVRGIQPVGASW